MNTKQFSNTLILLLGLFTASMSLSVLAVNELSGAAETVSESAQQCAPFLDHQLTKLHSSETVSLCQLTAGKTVLLVNTASNCGFTPQFKGLEALYKKYQNQGLVVIGFPSDDFFQEEDDEKDTAKVCFVNYGVTFTMVKTSAVRGSDVNPIFKHLGDKTTSPKWNFYKYLVTNNGESIQHFNSRVAPDDEALIGAIEAALKS